MKIVDVVQRSPEWHAFRSGGIGGSEIAAIMGMSPYKTELQVFLEKTGAVEPADLSKNPHVRRGIEMEDHISSLAQRHLGERGAAICGIHEDMPHLRASFDLVTPSWCIEIKAPSDKQWDWMIEHGPHPWYVVQNQYQQLVAEKLGLRGKLAYWRQITDADGKPRQELRMFDIGFDRDIRETIIEAARRFWDCIESGTPPGADPERDVLTEAQMDAGTLDAWRQIAQRAKAREAEAAKLKMALAGIEAADKADLEALGALIGDRFAGSAAGVRYSRFWRSGTIDYPAALAELAPTITELQLAPFRKSGAWSNRLTIERPEAVKMAARKAA